MGRSRGHGTRVRGGLRSGPVVGDDLAQPAGQHASSASATPGSSRITRSKSHDAMREAGRRDLGGDGCASRGAPSSTESSPKNSPGPRRATTWPSRTTRTRPSTTMKNPRADLALAGDRALGPELDLGRDRGDGAEAPCASRPRNSGQPDQIACPVGRGQRHGVLRRVQGWPSCAADRARRQRQPPRRTVRRRHCGTMAAGTRAQPESRS